MLLNAQAIGYSKRLMARKYCCSAISLLLCVVPIGVISRNLKIYLPLLKLGLLKGEEVCVERRESFKKILAYHSPEAIHVPGDEFKFHGLFYPFFSLFLNGKSGEFLSLWS